MKWLIPLAFGLLSVLLGQDDNWDLKNYHLYNAYALLNGRIGTDLAPALFQSYFNPTLDLFYYGLVQTLPGPLVGFIMGALHGLNFLLVLAIAQTLLGKDEKPRLAWLLALAGTLGTGFLAELGNSMGDNMMALLVLASLLVALRQWKAGSIAARPALAAGLLMGLGTGLKLTNATYAVGLCLAYLAAPMDWRSRVKLAFLFGLGELAGIGITAGYWFVLMWQHFGNPLFPQFNNLFHSALAVEQGVLDLAHVPKSLLEAALWPFIFTRDMLRVSELQMKQTIWPVLYTLGIVLAATRRRWTPLAVFFVVSYLAWLKLFGIYRYLIPLELLAPLAAWLIMQALFPSRRVAGLVLAITTASAFPFVTWGHSSWAATSFSAEAPAIAKPQDSVILIAHGHPPMGWLASFMPKEAQVMSLNAGFPESEAYRSKVKAAMAARPGPHYLLLYKHTNHEEVTLAKKNALADTLGLTGSPEACARLGKWMSKVRFHVDVTAAPAPRLCTLTLQSAFVRDVAAEDQALLDATAATLQAHGISIDASSCKTMQAAIGAEPYPYRLCAVSAAQAHIKLP